MEIKKDFTRQFVSDYISDFREGKKQIELEEDQLILSIASDKPYLRHQEGQDYWEVLKIGPEYIDQSRFYDDVMPLLKDHKPDQQIGVVKQFWYENNKIYVKVKFSGSAFAQSIMKDIVDGIRRNTSIGYQIIEYEMGTPIDGIPVLYATKWLPYECSSVSIPADITTGYKRSLNEEANMKDEKDIKNDVTGADATVVSKKSKRRSKKDCGEDQKIEAKQEENEESVIEEAEEKKSEDTEAEEVQTKTEEADEVKTDEAPENEETKEAEDEVEEKKSEDVKITDEYEKTAIEIKSIGEWQEIDAAEVENFIQQKRSIEEFKSFIKQKRESKNSHQKDEKIMDKKYFSISKAIRNACSQYKKDVSEEYETQVINENKRNLGNVDDADIVLSKNELHKRALGPTAGKGAELIATDYLPGEFSPALRPQLTLEQTGYYTIPVNGNAVSFAVTTSGTTAGMQTLDGDLVSGDMSFATRTLTPKKGGVVVPVPYSLILQGRPEIDAMVESDIVNALYQLRDDQILIGTGSDGEVSGLFSNTDIPTVTGYLSATATSAAVSGAWGTFLRAENEIRKNNIWGGLSIVMNGNNYVKFSTTVKSVDNCYAGFVLEDYKIKDIPVYINNKLTDDQIIMGDFSQLCVADFEGLRMKIDDITFIKKQAVQIVAWAAFDAICRRPGAFCKVVIN